jgi:hypothetical protein
MAREVNKISSRKGARKETLPFTKKNYQILGAALVVILAGYVALAQKPWDGFMPLVVAPILLVAGYCVLVPLGILYRGKKENEVSGGTPEQNPTAASQNPSAS